MHIQRGSLRFCTLALSQTSLNKRHDRYLVASLWVVATQVRASLTIFELSSVTSSWSESSLKSSTAFKASFQQRKRGESERLRRSSAGCERVQALAGGPRAVAPRLMPCSSFEAYLVSFSTRVTRLQNVRLATSLRPHTL